MIWIKIKIWSFFLFFLFLFCNFHYFLYSLSSGLWQILRIFIYLIDNTLISTLIFQIDFFSLSFMIVLVKFNFFLGLFSFFRFNDLFFNFLCFIKGLLLNPLRFLFHLVLDLLVVFLENPLNLWSADNDVAESSDPHVSLFFAWAAQLVHAVQSFQKKWKAIRLAANLADALLWFGAGQVARDDIAKWHFFDIVFVCFLFRRFDLNVGNRKVQNEKALVVFTLLPEFQFLHTFLEIALHRVVPKLRIKMIFAVPGPELLVGILNHLVVLGRLAKLLLQTSLLFKIRIKSRFTWSSRLVIALRIQILLAKRSRRVIIRLLLVQKFVLHFFHLALDGLGQIFDAFIILFDFYWLLRLASFAHILVPLRYVLSGCLWFNCVVISHAISRFLGVFLLLLVLFPSPLDFLILIFDSLTSDGLKATCEFAFDRFYGHFSG